MSVTRIHDEWILEFLGREGAVSTQVVASRFGVRIELARSTLSHYRKRGYLVSYRDSTSTGTMNFWGLTEAGMVMLEKRKKLAARRRELNLV